LIRLRNILVVPVAIALAVGPLRAGGSVPPARAEHEVYYRYTVLGYVRDAAGRSREGVPVEVIRERTGLGYRGVTDAAGFYVVVLRLGDESAEETLRLRAGGRALAFHARFDVADHVRERGTRVDMAGDRMTEKPAAFAETLRQFLVR
jgi:hypothetical protein